MEQLNPYSPPIASVTDQQDGPTALAIEFVTPMIPVIAYTLLGWLFIAVALCSAAVVVMTLFSTHIPMTHFTLVIAAIGAASAFGVYGCCNNIRATVQLSERGIRIKQLFSHDYSWDMVKSWRQSTFDGTVSFSVNSNDYVQISNAATNRRRNRMIGDIFRARIGEPINAG